MRGKIPTVASVKAQQANREEEANRILSSQNHNAMKKEHTLQEMKDWLTLHVLDEENIGWMSDKEITDTFNKYYDGER